MVSNCRAVKGKILHGSVRNKYRARVAAQDIVGCKLCIYNARYRVSLGGKPCMYDAEKASEHGNKRTRRPGNVGKRHIDRKNI
jgi:hypothetical protein